MKLVNGNLTLENEDMDGILDIADKEGYIPVEAFIKVIEANGYNRRNVYTLELNMGQLRTPKYLELYSKIVTECWNNKPLNPKKNRKSKSICY